MEYINYLVYGKYARGTDGHINADDLREKIINHDGREAYYNHFDVRQDALQYEVDTGKTKFDSKKNKDVKVYRYVDDATTDLANGEALVGPTFKNAGGTCRPAFNLVGFDFDSDEKPELSLQDVQAFLNYFRFEVFYVAYSGSKGFHISVPFEYFGLPADENLPRTLRNLAHELKPHFNTLDTSVYNIGRKFRAPNTAHGKTGLFKTIISKTGVDTKSMDAIKEYCKTRRDTMYDNRVYPELVPNVALVKLLDDARATATYDKAKTGTALEPTRLEAYDGKICIGRLFEAEIDEGERNTTALILVNDLFKSGKHKEYCIERMTPWVARVMPEHRRDEVFNIIDDIYAGDRFYNHGCLEPIKNKYCSAKCGLWSKLAPDKRPTPVDAPKSAFKELLTATSKPATAFIQSWLEDNAASITLANNWYLNGDFINPIPRNVIEDKIFNASDVASRKEYKVVPQNKITAYLNTWSNDQREKRLDGLRKHLAYTGANDLVEKFLTAILSREVTALEVAVLKHWLWLVKRKLNGKSTERELMVVMSGVTNTGKTYAVTKLFKPLKELVDTMSLEHLGDERQDFRLVESAIVFCDEMAAAKRVNIEALKNKITSKWLNYRPLKTSTRLQGKNFASFIGTSNTHIIDIVKDPTSARRYYEYWVTEKCNWPLVNEIDYLEVWRSIDESQPTPYIQDHLAELAETQEGLRHTDNVEDWLDIEELIPAEGLTHDSVKPREAYMAYHTWLKDQSREREALGLKSFFNRMKELDLGGRNTLHRFYKIKSVGAFDPSS